MTLPLGDGDNNQQFYIGDRGNSNTGAADTTGTGAGMKGAPEAGERNFTGSAMSRLGYGFLAGGLNGARWAGRMAQSAWNKMIDLLQAAGVGISNWTGGLLSPRMGMVATGVGGGGGGVFMIISLLMVLFSPVKMDEPVVEKCQNVFPAADVRAGKSSIDADADKIAEEIYAVLAGAGMSDENIAGILGNFKHESAGLDPTAVEGIFDEPYRIGPKKQAAWDNNFEPQPKGIGLGQWTAERTYMLLDYADEKNADWYSIELQLGFMANADSGKDVFRAMIENKNEGRDSVEGATKYFMERWERPGIPALENRVKYAEEFFVKMENWTPDKAKAKSILGSAFSGSKSANNDFMMAVMNECSGFGGSTIGGNSDAAEAALTYAWSNQSHSSGNDGTDRYRFLHDEMFPGDPYYASCDRSVTTALVWSGTDATVPAGAVKTIYSYFMGEGKDKWEKVATGTHDSIEAKQKPGDILITQSEEHIYMYVGEENVEKVWGSTQYADEIPDGAAYVSGSLSARSPNVAGPGDHNGENVHVFRNKKKETDEDKASVKIPASMRLNEGDKSVCTTPGCG